jgi:RsmE family RNA methyltransferase
VNLLLAEAGEIDGEGLLELRDDRLRHLRRVLRVEAGARLRVGEIGGRIGEAIVLDIDDSHARLHVELDRDPPEPLPVELVLALPRPKMLRRILRSVTEAGVKRIHLINSYRVEKSYWQSPLLAPRQLRRYLRDGLEQAQDTILPEVFLHRRFRPFVEDELQARLRVLGSAAALLADPGSERAYPAVPTHPAVVLIGPEGGFIPFERELLIASGAAPVHLGERVLRVETAVLACLGRHLAGGSQSAVSLASR